MAMSTLESSPKLDWTRDNQMFERYRIWKRKVEFIFCSALSDATPKQLVSYLKYWMGDQGIPLIEKWESTGKLYYSNAEETPATEGGRRRILLRYRSNVDIFSRIEFNSSNVLSSRVTNYKNDIHKFS